MWTTELRSGSRVSFVQIEVLALMFRVSVSASVYMRGDIVKIFYEFFFSCYFDVNKKFGYSN